MRKVTEREEALDLANLILDRVYGDPDDDLAILSRQLLRTRERLEAAETGIAMLFDEIKHGDQAHQDWLRNKIDEHFAAWRKAKGGE